MHFCQNELYAILMIVPALAWLWTWLKQRWGVLTKKCSCGKEHTAAWWRRRSKRHEEAAPVPGPSTPIQE